MRTPRMHARAFHMGRPWGGCCIDGVAGVGVIRSGPTPPPRALSPIGPLPPLPPPRRAPPCNSCPQPRWQPWLATAWSNEEERADRLHRSCHIAPPQAGDEHVIMRRAARLHRSWRAAAAQPPASSRQYAAPSYLWRHQPPPPAPVTSPFPALPIAPPTSLSHTPLPRTVLPRHSRQRRVAVTARGARSPRTRAGPPPPPAIAASTRKRRGGDGYH